MSFVLLPFAQLLKQAIKSFATSFPFILFFCNFVQVSKRKLKKTMSTFKQWTRDKLREKFDLKRAIDHPDLLSWLATEAPIDAEEMSILERWRKKMLLYVDYWNEEEVKIKFIGTILTLTDYDTENLSAFADREFGGVVDEVELTGKPDFIVARGKQEMKSPFFFLHEYKKELDNDSPDPAGQLLAAMLVAYTQNLEVEKLKEKPVYGAYVVGRAWYFVMLKAREYCISLAYDATHKDQLIEILRILKANRQMIREIWGE